jgi:hypothetical protein
MEISLSGDMRSHCIKKGEYMELLMIAIGIASRLLPHPANVTAVGGLALFAGAKMDIQKAIIITLVTMVMSDIFLGFHSLMWATYGSMVVGVLVGKWIGKRVSTHHIIGGTLMSSLLFFIVTNFAVWAGTPLYPKTFNGLTTCYIMALPFFRNSLIGDCFYSFIFFYGHVAVRRILQAENVRKVFYAV